MTKNNIRIAENITKLRKEKSETQMQLAEAVGVSNKTISKWETAESEPELSYIAAIAEHYKVSMDSLIGEIPLRTRLTAHRIIFPTEKRR